MATASGTSSALAPDAGIRERLTSRGARRWYLGGAWGLAFQSLEFVAVWSMAIPLLARLLASAVLVVLYAAYVVLPPLVWERPPRVRLAALAAFWAATLTLLPIIGATTLWVWTLIVVMAGFTWLPARWTIGVIVAVVAAQVLVGLALDSSDGSVGYAAIVTASVGAMMLALSEQIRVTTQLRAAQTEIARLAAADERARMARDLHDVLGHSLTVVTMKLELARRLLPLDPDRAERELAETEELSRAALADLRSSVRAFREPDLAQELGTARAALVAAGVRPVLPADADVVAADLRPVFAWVLREGVTNVIRHARARTCTVELGPDSIELRDDGSGAPIPVLAGQEPAELGSGLLGLEERARQAGAAFVAAPLEAGGFRIRAERARAAAVSAPRAVLP